MLNFGIEQIEDMFLHLMIIGEKTKIISERIGFLEIL